MTSENNHTSNNSQTTEKQAPQKAVFTNQTPNSFCGPVKPAGKYKESPVEISSISPILNFKGRSIKVQLSPSIQEYKQITMTKEEYRRIHKDLRGVHFSACGQFKVHVCKHPDRQGWDAPWVWVYLIDAIEHVPPKSYSITY